MAEHVELAAVGERAGIDRRRVVHALADARKGAAAARELVGVVLHELAGGHAELIEARDREHAREYGAVLGARDGGAQLVVVERYGQRADRVFALRCFVGAELLGGRGAVGIERHALKGALVGHGAGGHGVGAGSAQHVERVVAIRYLNVGLCVVEPDVGARRDRADDLDLAGLDIKAAHVVPAEGHHRLVGLLRLDGGCLAVGGGVDKDVQLVRFGGVCGQLGHDVAADEQQLAARVDDRCLVGHIVARDLVGKVGPGVSRRIVREELFVRESAVVLARGRAHHEQLAVPERAAHVGEAAGEVGGLRPALAGDVVAPNGFKDAGARLRIVGVDLGRLGLAAAEHVDRAVERGEFVVVGVVIELARGLDGLLKDRNLVFRHVLGKDERLGVGARLAVGAREHELEVAAHEIGRALDNDLGVGPALDRGGLAAERDAAGHAAELAALDGDGRLVVGERGRADLRHARGLAGELAGIDHAV